TPRAPRFDLARETDPQLMARLASPNVFFRDLAQRILIERNSASTRVALEQLVLDERSPRNARMHALWALVGGGPLAVNFHLGLLSHQDAGLRAWGVRAAANAQDVAPSVRDRVVALAADGEADV